MLGPVKLHTRIKHNKNAPTNKYHDKDDQNCVFESVASSFASIGDSLEKENHASYVNITLIWNLWLILLGIEWKSLVVQNTILSI